MGRKVTPLTNTQIKQVKPRTKEFNLSDGDGLSLRVRPNGTKTWFFTYCTPYVKKRFKISFGSYPEVSLAEARKLRLEAKELLAKSIDPNHHRQELKQESIEEIQNTFGNFASKWLELKSKSVKQSTLVKRQSVLNLHLLPILSSIPVKKIKPVKVRECLDPLYAQGKMETLRRACQVVNEVLLLAMNSGVLESNPNRDIVKLYPGKKAIHNPTIQPDEIHQLIHDIYNAKIRETTRLLILWQLHTMVRPSEAAMATWEQIDRDNKVWHAHIEKMGRTLDIPLTEQTMMLLEQIKPISGHRMYLFPADRAPHKHANTQTVNMALKRMGYGGRLTSHGLRALASTTLNAQGFESDLIETALSHVDKNSIRSAYNRSDFYDRRIPMMEWWSGRLDPDKKDSIPISTRTLRRVI